MLTCPRCGTESTETARFCRRCGLRLPSPEESETQILGSSPHTEAMKPPPTGAAYLPPLMASEAPRFSSFEAQVDIGRWLSRGWESLKPDLPTFAVATLIATFLSLVTLTVTAGPFLIGLYYMVFKSQRGEDVQVADVFKGFEYFGAAFLAWVVELFIHLSLGGLAERTALLGLVTFAFSPLVMVLFAFVYPLILDRRVDIAAALNDAWKVVVSRQWLMFWVFGVILWLLPLAGLIVCVVGFFLTTPLAIAASAAAYRDLFGVRSWPSAPVSESWFPPES
jgi:hypothetical protein